jgi:hypothetical protein
MTKKVGTLSLPTFFLQLFLGVFFLVLGISNLTHYNSGLSEFKRAFGNNDTLSVIMAVIEIVMGAFLVLGLFVSASTDMTKLLGLVLFVLWALYMVVTFIVQDFLKPSLLPWLYQVSWNAIILISLWIVGRRYI